MAKNKTINEREHPASEKSDFISVRGQSHSGCVSKESEDYQSVSSKDVSSVMRRWDIETPIEAPLCESFSVTDMCSICAAKGIGKIATHICRDCSRYGRYYCQSCWDYHNKFLPTHDTLSLSVSSDSDDEINMWLNELKQQIEKDEYNEKTFDKKPNGNVESAKLSVFLKEICTIIQRRSKRQRLINKVSATRRFIDVIDWLNTLLQQISDSKYDDKVFLKSKTLEGSREELNKCHKIIVDCCRKLKNENDSKMSANKEIKLLLNEIKEWNDIKTINEAKEDCKDPVVKAFREGRLQVHKWKKEFKSEKEKKEDTRKLTKNQEQAIKDILTIIDKDKNTSGKVDIANYLDKIEQHVSVTRENLDQIEIEVHSLLEEINAWDDTTPLKKATGNACKEVEALRESRLKLHKRKLDLKSLRELENKSQYNRQVFGDLCTLLKMDLEPRQKGESNDNWKDIVKNMKRLVKDRCQFVDRARTLLKDISTLITREPFSLTMSGHSDTKLVQVLTPDFQQLVYDMNNVKLCLEDYRKSHKEKFVKIEAWNELKECDNSLQKEIEELKDQKDELLNRLSKIAGEKLTLAIADLSDLSDPNRATKLAEKFSELYDDSWNDAYEVLEISYEKECIQYLLNIIVESYSMCAGISNNQQRALARALHYPTEGLSIKTITNEQVSHDSDLNLSELQSRTLSDLRKTSAELSIEDVKLYITAKNENWARKRELKQFTLSCIELCWFMHLQSPPVYLDATLVSGSTFDTNKYKPYTKSGKKIDFIVWPSLYLHKGGPILCKGVAQGK